MPDDSGSNDLEKYVKGQEAQKNAFDNLSSGQKEQGEKLNAILAAVTGSKEKKPKPDPSEPSPQPSQGKPRRRVDLSGYVKREEFTSTVEGFDKRIDGLRDNLDEKTEELESFRDSLRVGLQEAKDASRHYTDASVVQLEEDLITRTNTRLGEFAGVVNEFVNDSVSDAKAGLETRIGQVETKAEAAKAKAEDIETDLGNYKKDFKTSRRRTAFLTAAATLLLSTGLAVAVAATKNPTVNINYTEKGFPVNPAKQRVVSGISYYVPKEDDIFLADSVVPVGDQVWLNFQDVDDYEAAAYLGEFADWEKAEKKGTKPAVKGIKSGSRQMRIQCESNSWAQILSYNIGEYKFLRIKPATTDAEYAKRRIKEDSGSGNIFYIYPEGHIEIIKPPLVK